MEEDTYTRITLRIPKRLHTELQAAADSSSKSMNAEIIARLSSNGSQQNETIIALATQVARQDLTIQARKLDLASASEMLAKLLAELPASALADKPELRGLARDARSFSRRYALANDDLKALSTAHGIAFQEYALELTIAEGVAHHQPLLGGTAPGDSSESKAPAPTKRRMKLDR